MLELVVKNDTLREMKLSMSKRHIKSNHWLRIMLIALLLLTIWHTATHDLDISNDLSEHTECQVCRLNHVPVDNLALPTLLVPSVLISLLFSISIIQGTAQSYRYTPGARAPPLF